MKWSRERSPQRGCCTRWSNPFHEVITYLMTDRQEAELVNGEGHNGGCRVSSPTSVRASPLLSLANNLIAGISQATAPETQAYPSRAPERSRMRRELGDPQVQELGTSTCCKRHYQRLAVAWQQQASPRFARSALRWD